MFENDLCNRCGLPGHLQKDCSLAWRRYVFAREPTRHEVERAAALLAPQCYNCAAPSHYGDECPSRRRAVEWSIFHAPNWEFLQQAAYLSQERQARASPKRRYEEEHQRRNHTRTEQQEGRNRDRHRSGEGESSLTRDHGRRHREHHGRHNESLYRRNTSLEERNSSQDRRRHPEGQKVESQQEEGNSGSDRPRRQHSHSDHRQQQAKQQSLPSTGSHRRHKR